VVGAISLGPGNILNLQLRAYRVDNGSLIKSLSGSILLTEQTSKQMSKPSIEVGYPKAGTESYSTPRCISCFKPGYTAAASTARTQGIVRLAAIVDTDGRLKKIEVMQGLPCGLSEMAIEAATNSIYAPATGPDGKPAAVQVNLEFEFKLDR
jgi:TonB family protein